MKVFLRKYMRKAGNAVEELLIATSPLKEWADLGLMEKREEEREKVYKPNCED